MRKRVGVAFAVSGLFPLLALSVWMLRIAGPESRWVALLQSRAFLEAR